MGRGGGNWDVGTGTRELERGNVGLGDAGRGDSETWDSGTWDAGTWGRVETRGRKV